MSVICNSAITLPAARETVPTSAHHASQMLVGQLAPASCSGVHAAPAHRSLARAASCCVEHSLPCVPGLIRGISFSGHPAACKEVHVLGARGVPAAEHLPASDNHSCARDDLQSCAESADMRYAVAIAQQPVCCKAAHVCASKLPLNVMLSGSGLYMQYAYGT
jgi:hypothetical protein